VLLVVVAVAVAVAVAVVGCVVVVSRPGLSHRATRVYILHCCFVLFCFVSLMFVVFVNAFL
jgi:hypothetical protein